LLVFRYAIGRFVGVTKGRHIDAVRPRSSNVQQNELQRASQCAVGAGHIAEDILPRPETKLLSYRSIDQDQRRSEMSSCLHSMNVEPLVTGSAYQRQKHAH